MHIALFDLGQKLFLKGIEISPAVKIMNFVALAQTGGISCHGSCQPVLQSDTQTSASLIRNYQLQVG